MSGMFDRATVFNQNIGTWNTATVTNMSFMFSNASTFNNGGNSSINNWNTGAVTDMRGVFFQASAFNQNIGGWNTAAATNMRFMFYQASAFNQNIGTWTLNSGVNLTSILDDSGVDCNNYSATLLGWSANPLTPNGRTLGAVGRQYGTNAVAARNNLVSSKSWTITGDTPSGTVCSSASIPTIASFSPASGPIGTSITITGTNFSTTPANNIVYFGATKATVTVATTTQLTVTVPTGATYQPISVLVNGLTAFSNKPFITTFADGGVIDACAFAAKVDITTGSAPYSVAVGDLDADGKPDLAVANQTGNTVSVYKNISTLGSLGSSSFEAKVDFVTGASPYFVMIQDLDGDGKPELIATSNGSDKVSIFKNNATPGVINSSSFAAKVDFSTGQNPWIATVADFDQDGKPDLAIVNDVDNTVSILKNTSTTGVINTSSFASKVDFATGNFPIGIASGDLDGDGKVDLAVTNQTDNTVSVLRNTSTPGNIDATSFDPKIDFPTGLDPYSVAIGDLDGDNKPEIAVANYSSGSVSVFGNDCTVGTINFLTKEDFSSGAGSGTVSINDIDGNGKPDLNIASDAEGISVLKNIGTSTPISASSFSSRINFTVPNPYGLAIADLDGNGKPDVVSTNSSGTTASILRNTVSSLPSFTGGSLTPTSGPVGTVVTITGANFSTTPFNNTVKFNGVVATVTSSTSTSITTSVPVGATTGSLSLEIGCVQAFTIFPFTITTGATITIATQPADASICAGATTSFTTAATGTTNITYQWQRYIVASSLLQNIINGGAYSGATTATLTINSSAGPISGDYYTCVVSGDNAPPVSTNFVTLTVSTTPCNNQPPSIATASSTTQIEGKVSLDLVLLISDADNNVDIQSLKIKVPPTSGAKASITASGRLELDYQGLSFAGTDVLTIEVCDLLGDCTQQEIIIEVIGDLNIYTGISANGDGLNDFWIIRYIDVIAETKANKVSVYNRWGDVVFETENYDNTNRVFKGLNKNGNELSSGTYFYKIEFSSGRKTQTGYLSLKR